MATPEEAYKAAAQAVSDAEQEGRILVVIVSTADGTGARVISNIPVTALTEMDAFVKEAMKIAVARFQN